MGIIIIGAGGHGRTVLDVLKNSRKDIEICFVDDDENLVNCSVNGVLVLGTRKSLVDLKLRGYDSFIVGVGVTNILLRKKICDEVALLGFKNASAIHPLTSISADALIGEGCMFGPFSVVGPNVKIGKNSILYSGVAVEHDSSIGDNVCLSPGVRLSGNVSVGENSFLGTGAVAIPGVKIGNNVIVGAGSVVIKDIPNDMLVAGVPARIIRECGH